MVNKEIYEYINFIDNSIIYEITKDYGMQTYSKINDLAAITAYSSNNEQLGPIMILKGLFEGNDIFLVVISGTELNSKHQNGINADIMSGLELNNNYLKCVINSIKNNIILNSNILIIGNSLGGMIAQQVVSDDFIKNNYNVVSVITFGSPIINPYKRSCRVRRMCDKSDIVTKLSLSSFFNNNKQLDNIEKCVEDGGYNNFIDAHKYSYIYNKVWNKYDVIGVKNGSNIITLDMNSIKYYNAF